MFPFVQQKKETRSGERKEEEKSYSSLKTTTKHQKEKTPKGTEASLWLQIPKDPGDHSGHAQYQRGLARRALKPFIPPVSPRFPLYEACLLAYFSPPYTQTPQNSTLSPCPRPSWPSFLRGCISFPCSAFCGLVSTATGSLWLNTGTESLLLTAPVCL